MSFHHQNRTVYSSHHAPQPHGGVLLVVLAGAVVAFALSHGYRFGPAAPVAANDAQAIGSPRAAAYDAAVQRLPECCPPPAAPSAAVAQSADPIPYAPAVPDVQQVQHFEFIAPEPPPTARDLPAPPPAPAPPAPVDEAPEAAPGQYVLPLKTAEEFDGTVEAEDGLVSIAVREAPLHAVLSLLAKQQGLSIVASSQLKQPITVTLQPTTLENALDALLAIADCTWKQRNNVIYVTSLKKDATTSPFFQGREIRVFTLNYASATDVEKVVTGLLSSVGSVFVRQIDPMDKRKTSEQLVVEDLPPFLDRIEQYVEQADVMPRQVLIEAHILQVRLGKDKAHGVNFDALARVSGARVQLWGKGFAEDTGPGMVFTIDGTDYHSLIDCLTTTTDAKTLASPKVLVVNGQESRIQIGERLGYFVTTTTQTSTLQDVQFLEVGVVLTVVPHITADGQVLMHVSPKVSTGDINPVSGLPDEETTQVDTSVLVPNGQGIIIGGLIQEDDIDRQSKLGWLGDMWGVGRLFQRRTLDRERNEVIVALLPRIVDCPSCVDAPEAMQLERSTTPLLTPGLHSNCRPWEPRLPDAADRPVWLFGTPVEEDCGEACEPAEGEVLQLPPVEVIETPVAVPMR